MHVLMKPWAPLARFPIDQNIFLAFALTVAIIFSSETLSASSAPDSDSDGQNDFYEAICGSDPFSSESKSLDTDGDRLPDCVDNDADSNGIHVGSLSNGGLEFFKGTSGSSNWGSPKLTIATNGNVGINNANPASKLSVDGLPSSPPDDSGNAGVVCVTNEGNFWLDSDGNADCQ